MISLIAESKTMSTDQQTVTPEEFSAHCPFFESEAVGIISNLSHLAPLEIAQRVKISPALAAKSMRMIYEFPDKSTGLEALRSFTGEVYRALQISTLSKEAIQFSYSHLMIVSSLYGLLRPLDIVKPYRLDFNSKCGPEDENLSKFWKTRLTIAFVKHLKESGEREVLDLLPSEAAKCIDWKIVKAFAKVIKIDFKTVDDNGELKTPNSSKLKELRGLMLRTIFSQQINDFSTLLSVKTADFAADPDLSRPGRPLFVAL